MKTVLSLGLRIAPVALLLLSGCDGVRETLGFQHNTPDEFAVATAPPLAIPPDYTLRPPQPGADPSQSMPAQAQAQAALIGDSAAGNRTATPSSSIGGGEAALLQAAGSKPQSVMTAADGTVAPSLSSPEAQRLETALFGTPLNGNGGGDAAPTIAMKTSTWYNSWY